jgi:hypothetical protein
MGVDNDLGRMRIDYRAPRLSVEASGISLAQLLRAIGAKVGFTVVDAGMAADPVTVAIRDAPVEDVLRQLLRGTNHAVLYPEKMAPVPSAIDKIVLLGLSGGAFTASVEPGRPGATPAVPEMRDLSIGRVPIPNGGSRTTDLPWPSSGNTLMSLERSSAFETSGDSGAIPTSVADLLRTHATGAPQTPPMEANLPPSSLASIDNPEVQLAEATRRAYMDLSGLLQGLGAATQALQNSLANRPKPATR